MNEIQSTNEPNERLIDLMIQRATEGLSESEQRELDQLATSVGDPQELERIEIVATAFDLSFSSIGQTAEPQEELPRQLRDQLLISAGQYLAGETPSNEPSVVNDSLSTAELRHRPVKHSSVRWREVLAVAVMAASLLLMFSGFNPFAKTTTAPIASVAQRMDQFLSSQPNDLVDIAWQPVHTKNAGGKVLWSDSAQEGYMVLSGLNVNDPKLEQYQLWIFDTDPGQETPVDGGVFDISQADINAAGEAVIPIHPTVPVRRAVQFAVTVETPGGVYVSKREKIPVLAKLESID